MSIKDKLGNRDVKKSVLSSFVLAVAGWLVGVLDRVSCSPGRSLLHSSVTATCHGPALQVYSVVPSFWKFPRRTKTFLRMFLSQKSLLLEDGSFLFLSDVTLIEMSNLLKMRVSTCIPFHAQFMCALAKRQGWGHGDLGVWTRRQSAGVFGMASVSTF